MGVSFPQSIEGGRRLWYKSSIDFGGEQFRELQREWRFVVRVREFEPRRQHTKFTVKKTVCYYAYYVLLLLYYQYSMLSRNTYAVKKTIGTTVRTDNTAV